MSTTTHSGDSSSLFNKVRTGLRQVFGPPADDIVSDPTTATNTALSESDVVIAPGGFQIQLPKPSDGEVKHHTDSFDDLVPEFREGLKLLPPLPNVVLELLREIQSSSSSASSVAQIASSDPSLAASLLRAVNSAAFGLSQKVTSIPQAISLLGFNSVRSLVVRFRLAALLPHRSEQAAVDAENIWTHSLIVSYIAAALASRMSDVDRGFVSTVGLLHDLGRLVICSQHPNFIETLRNTGKPSDSILDRETSAFGKDHAAIGALLGNRWKLPADINTAIRWHHNPENGFEATDPLPLKKALFLVHLADQLAKYCYTYADDMHIDQPTSAEMEFLGLQGTLPQLLDAKIRAAATQAILFTDENSKCPLTMVRPFLKLRRGQEAADLVSRVEQNGQPNIAEGAAGSELIESFETIHEFNPAKPKSSDLAGATGARYSAPATHAAFDWLLKEFDAHMQTATVPATLAAEARAVLRALLPNLLGSADSFDVAWQWNSSKLQLAARSNASAFASRLPQNTTTTTARLVLDAELANITNLGWFEAETSTDGTTLLFRSK